MFTDIVGYTSLMGEDEQKAFETINANREIHQRLTEKHHGKIVKELGDGLLTVFENGTEAVLCAVDIQKEASEKNIPLRIGIHEGEVVFENGDVFGDGVNIASRIQDEAAPGGVCISDSVYRIIKNKTDIKTGSIGTRHLKNVDEDIKLYQVKADGVNVFKSSSNWKKSKALTWLLIIPISILFFIGGWFLNIASEKESSNKIEKFDIVLPAKAPIVCKQGILPVAISPDGTLIVYQAFTNNKMFLYKRYLDQYEAIPIPGTEGGQYPFFSPDGDWIGYHCNGLLKKVLIEGGIPINICEAPGYSSGTWLPDNTIITTIVGEGLVRVSAAGGNYSTITHIDLESGEWIHDHPFCLPDGKTILFSVRNGAGNLLYIKSFNLDNHEEKVILQEAMHPMYISSGYLTYIKNGHLMATSFDPKNLNAKEPEIFLIKNIAYLNPSISLAENGTLVYVPEQALLDELVWVDMNGVTQTIISDNDRFYGPRISPDGNNIAMWIASISEGEVYIYDIHRESLDKLTNSGQNFWPVWTPDGRHIAFPTFRGDGILANMYWKAIDKSTPAEPLLKIKYDEDMKNYAFQPQMWTSDGRKLLFVTLGEDVDIMMMDMENDSQFTAFIATEFDERHPRLSPDNKWIAYQSTESGRYEIYVIRFPEKGARWQISTNGGTEPIWSPDGNKIYYRHNDHIMVVDISTDVGFRAGKPEVQFSGKFKQLADYGWYYDLHPDGDRFVMVKAAEIDTTQNHIKVIRNFPKEIESKFASAR
jgi:serine/threonine-protein kinase